MNIKDKAEQAETDSIDLAADLLESQYRLKSLELVGADDIGTDEFPQYGDFAEVAERSPVDGTYRGDRYVEVTAELAEWLVENDVGSEDWWQVVGHEKNGDGRHKFDVQLVSD